MKIIIPYFLKDKCLKNITIILQKYMACNIQFLWVRKWSKGGDKHYTFVSKTVSANFDVKWFVFYNRLICSLCNSRKNGKNQKRWKIRRKELGVFSGKFHLVVNTLKPSLSKNRLEKITWTWLISCRRSQWSTCTLIAVLFIWVLCGFDVLLVSCWSKKKSK